MKFKINDIIKKKFDYFKMGYKLSFTDNTEPYYLFKFNSNKIIKLSRDDFFKLDKEIQSIKSHELIMGSANLLARGD